MPFQSKKQLKLCFALKHKNPNSKWNCEEWLKETKEVKYLPVYKPTTKNRSRSRSRSKSRNKSKK
jgi:hypothetical protein